VRSIKAYGGVEERFHSFLTLALDGGDWSTSCPVRFNPEKEGRYLMHNNNIHHTTDSHT